MTGQHKLSSSSKESEKTSKINEYSKNVTLITEEVISNKNNYIRYIIMSDNIFFLYLTLFKI